MKFEKTEVFNFTGALRGMRNPLDSWSKADTIHYQSGELKIGESDLNLAQRLIKAGPEHCKFLRQIFVSVDITAPLYWWTQCDTYKVGTTANSCSKMHTLTKKPISVSDFSLDESLTPNNTEESYIDSLVIKDIITDAINNCEKLRVAYVETKDKRYWRALIQLLPESFNQKRTLTLNYSILRNMYHQRKNHKLQEWQEFCTWVSSLPYANEFIFYKGDDV